MSASSRCAVLCMGCCLEKWHLHDKRTNFTTLTQSCTNTHVNVFAFLHGFARNARQADPRVLGEWPNVQIRELEIL